MNTQEFLSLLAENSGKELMFEYAPSSFVDRAYHITEVKNVYFDSVDCGGNTHSERQTVVQLWVNPLERKNKNMFTEKALSILEKVDQVKALNRSAEIFFEFGNKSLPTSNYSIKSFTSDAERVWVKMYVQPTACKPIQLLETSGKACCGNESKCC
jgi:hypothetical protein